MNKTTPLPLLSVLGAVGLWLGIHVSPSPAKAPIKPNILFFFIDDMGWQDTSEPFWHEVTALNRRYRTPNMVKLADQGIKFTQAYACAVCSPSRVSLMTGLNAARHKVTNWTLRKNKSPDPNHPVLQPPAWNLNGLALTADAPRMVQATTLPALLKQAGYRTIHVGKAHFAADGTRSEDPRQLGFDVNIAGHCAGGPGSYHGRHDFSAAWRKGDRIWDVPGLSDYHGQDIYLTEALTLEANKAVTQAVDDGKPFYLYMSHYAVHAPWEEDARFLKNYTDQGIEGLEATYASMIEGMDKSLGDILENLERLGVDDHTIVVFMTDNGCPKNLPRNLPLRGHKLTAYEGGTRVPMIVKWPGVVQPGTVCSEDYVIIEDIFPSFLEMAGITDDAAAAGRIDGRSFVPLLNGVQGISKGRSIFWHFPHTYDQPAYSSVRRDDWKLIYFHANRRLELYNLKRDIGETMNLADQEPETLAELIQILSDFLRESAALMPIDKKTDSPVEYPDEWVNLIRTL
jgi:arylsulfatase A-like enzyme